MFESFGQILGLNMSRPCFSTLMLSTIWHKKLLGGSWNFHVWNPKPLLFMIDLIRQSLGLGVDTWFSLFEYV
jgi:hypothetical protein